MFFYQSRNNNANTHRKYLCVRCRHFSELRQVPTYILWNILQGIFRKLHVGIFCILQSIFVTHDYPSTDQLLLSLLIKVKHAGILVVFTYCCPDTNTQENNQTFLPDFFVAYCCVQKCELSCSCHGHDFKVHPHRVILYRTWCVGSGIVVMNHPSFSGR
jgi:hypothetical protein